MRSSPIAVRAGGGAKKPGPRPRPIGVRADRCRTNFTKAVKRRSMLVKLRKRMCSQSLRLKNRLAAGVFGVRPAAQTRAVKARSSSQSDVSPNRWKGRQTVPAAFVKKHKIVRIETTTRDQFSACRTISIDGQNRRGAPLAKGKAPKFLPGPVLRRG